jgi:DNA-binding MarR family transcriptional regulator
MSKVNELSLSGFLPFRLSVLSNTVSRRIAERYEREFGLSIWEWRVMAVLGEEDGQTATSVSERTAMDKVTVSRAVAGLVERKLLLRRASQSDGRTSMLFMTKAGRATYEGVAPIALAMERDLTQALTRQERVMLDELLTKLAGAASPERALW